jgi:hypothetical protein
MNAYICRNQIWLPNLKITFILIYFRPVHTVGSNPRKVGFVTTPCYIAIFPQNKYFSTTQFSQSQNFHKLVPPFNYKQFWILLRKIRDLLALICHCLTFDVCTL